MTWTTSSHRVFVLLIFLFIAASFAFAQTSTTSLRGTILDPGGAVVPDAEVTLSNPEIGVALATHSDKDGFYQFRLEQCCGFSIVPVSATKGFRDDGVD